MGYRAWSNIIVLLYNLYRFMSEPNPLISREMIKQSIIIDKVNLWLAHMGRTARLDNEGICHGLSAWWLEVEMSGNPNLRRRFDKMIHQVSSWEESDLEEYAKASNINILMHRFVNNVLCLQAAKGNVARLSQDEVHRSMDFVFSAAAAEEYHIVADSHFTHYFDKDDLGHYLLNHYEEGQGFIISSKEHTIAVFHQPDIGFQFYDPNANEIITIPDSSEIVIHLQAHLRRALGYIREARYFLSIQAMHKQRPDERMYHAMTFGVQKQARRRLLERAIEKQSIPFEDLLYCAIKNGDRYAEDRILRIVDNPEVICDFSQALYAACEVGDSDKVLAYLKLKADPNAVCMHNLTPLLYCLENEKLDLAQLLVDAKALPLRAEASAEELLAAQQYFFTAIENNLLGSISFLKTNGLLSADIMDTPNPDGLTPFLYALKMRHTDIARELFEQVGKLDAVDKHDNTALHYAATAGMTTMIQALTDEALYDARVNINQVNDKGLTPLALALRHDAGVSVINTLLSRGASIKNIPKDCLLKLLSTPSHHRFLYQQGKALLMDLSQALRQEPKSIIGDLVPLLRDLPVLKCVKVPVGDEQWFVYEDAADVKGVQSLSRKVDTLLDGLFSADEVVIGMQATIAVSELCQLVKDICHPSFSYTPNIPLKNLPMPEIVDESQLVRRL